MTEINKFSIFVKKSLYNLVNWSYFHIFASRRVSLKERNTFLLNNPRLFYYSCGITPQYNSYKY
ncbi:hypothetical protein DWX44_03150 [Bacteroides uniformis]|nr:hypothetical protein DWX44_03150 [Bacteroides uniformis]